MSRFPGVAVWAGHITTVETLLAGSKPSEDLPIYSFAYFTVIVSACDIYCERMYFTSDLRQTYNALPRGLNSSSFYKLGILFVLFVINVHWASS